MNHRFSRRALLGTGAALAATAALPRSVFAAEQRDVIIIGAGLSGLNAAMVLAEQGCRVTVLETAPRIGGRVFTSTEIEGSPEHGASQLGPFYARTLDRAHQLDVKLAPGANLYADYAISFDGKLMNASDWENSPVNKTVGPERRIAPQALAGYYMTKNNPFDGLDEWTGPEALAKYDVSALQWLKQVGASDAALEVIGRGLAEEPLNQVSILTQLQEIGRPTYETRNKPATTNRDVFEQYARSSQHVVGGSSRLTDAMAASLKGAVLTRKKAVRIDMTETGATVTCGDGSVYKGDFVVSALPFSKLRDIAITPDLAGEQAAAVKTMPHGGQSQVWLRVKAPYWDDDGITGSIWSDSAVSLLRQTINYDGTRTTATVLASGAKGAVLDSMPHKERGEFVLAELGRIRPSTKGKLEVLGCFSWKQDAYVGGCRHSFQPGQMKRFRPVMAQPHARLHFAGEQTRMMEVGMEAAMESGERAALEILARA